MTSIIKLSHPTGIVEGKVPLVASKSISNRLLLMRAFSGKDFVIHNLSKAADTQILIQCLKQTSGLINAGEGGTTYRFLMAFLAFQEGVQELHASGRMKERPVGILVDALNALGARITYLGKKGFPPLRIDSPRSKGTDGQISIQGSLSSQFISALLMAGPILTNGLRLQLIPPVVSASYIRLTIDLMTYLGISVDWVGDIIRILPQEYQVKEMIVENDWSAASYFYSLASLAKWAKLVIPHLDRNSVQGDAVLAAMMGAFSVHTSFTGDGVVLRQEVGRERSLFQFDFLENPDLAQTLAILCAAKGVHGVFAGLQTLRIKETDRILALEKELEKIGAKVHMVKGMQGEEFIVEGRWQPNGIPVFESWGDHRMAMALAPLALISPIMIKKPEVVGKSYPSFWDDLEKLGFRIQKADE